LQDAAWTGSAAVSAAPSASAETDFQFIRPLFRRTESRLRCHP
jgi:hypothetical protein